MRDLITANLAARFQSYLDLANSIDDDVLAARIQVPKHKTLGEHFWCIVGARESYARAIVAGEWSGFSCTMSSFGRTDYIHALQESAKAVIDSVQTVTDWTPAQEVLLATLAEHEVMHEGQIIRHIYGLEKSLPASCKWA